MERVNGQTDVTFSTVSSKKGTLFRTMHTPGILLVKVNPRAEKLEALIATLRKHD